jgi:hypothetical protein
MTTTASSPRMMPKLQGRSRSQPREGKMKSLSRELVMHKNQACTQSKEERPTTPSMPTSSTPRMTPNLQGRSRSQPREGNMKSVSREMTIHETHAQSPHSKKSHNESGIERFNNPSVPFDSNGYCTLHKDVQIAKKTNNGEGWSMWSTIRPNCPKCATLVKSHLSGETESMTSEESSVDHHRQHDAAKQISLRSSARDQHSSGQARCGWNPQHSGNIHVSNPPDRDHGLYKRSPRNRSPRPMQNTSRREDISSRQRCQSSGAAPMTREESLRGYRGQRRHNNGVTNSFQPSASDRQTSGQVRGQKFAHQRRHNNGVRKSPPSPASDRQTSGQARGQNFVRRRTKSAGDHHLIQSHLDKYADYERRGPPLHHRRLWEHRERCSYSPDDVDDHVSVDSGVSKLTTESGFTDVSDTLRRPVSGSSPRSYVIRDDNDDSFLN